MPSVMTERSRRLTTAFQRSEFARSGLSARATALRLGWNVSSFKSYLNGHAPFSFKAAKNFAEKLKVRAEWLYDGHGPMQEPIEVPLLSWVSAGQLAEIGDIDSLGDIEHLVVGDLPPGDYFATTVVGDSTDRVAPEGARLIVNAADRHPRDGKFYIFSLRGETTFKRYRSRPVRRLEPFSTNPAHEPLFLADKGWTVIGRAVRAITELA